MAQEEIRKRYGRNLEIQMYIIFFLILLSSIANILFLVPSFFILLFLVTLRFKIKNYKSKLYYVFQVTIILLQGLILLVCYLFKSIYLNSLSLIILFYGFVALYIFLIMIMIYFYCKGIPLYY